MKHVFVFDPKAFYNQQWKMDNILDGIGQYFRTQEKVDFSVQFSRYRRNAIGIINDEAEKTAADEIIRIYAIGGEEVLFDCLNASAHFPNTQLALIPYGESNSFLKIFGEDKAESFKDIPSLVQGRALPTDIIKWGINYALNSCYIGMDSAISRNLKDLKSRSNKGSYLLFSIIPSFTGNFFVAFDKRSAARDYKITIDDSDYSGQYSLIHIANGPYHAGKKTGASEAVPDDGLLNITLIRASHPLGTLASVSKYLNGKRPKNCLFTQGKKISVHSDNQMCIQIDNEYVLDTDINLNVVHHAAQIVAAEGLSYLPGSNSAL
ncbi:MAG: hypothetical protein FWC06_04060 [Treponema sp.]|nr:hypothetical protein [Treponema sp.]